MSEPSPTSIPTSERMKKAGITVHESVWDDVHDTTGRFTDAQGNPYQYAGHWSWIYFDNNENKCTSCTTELNEWKWLAAEIVGKVIPPTDVQGTRHSGGYNVLWLIGAAVPASYLALRKINH